VGGCRHPWKDSRQILLRANPGKISNQGDVNEKINVGITVLITKSATL